MLKVKWLENVLGSTFERNTESLRGVWPMSREEKQEPTLRAWCRVHFGVTVLVVLVYQQTNRNSSVSHMMLVFASWLVQFHYSRNGRQRLERF